MVFSPKWNKKRKWEIQPAPPRYIPFIPEKHRDKENTVLYVCDGKACESCSNGLCNHTEKIEHARNFRRVRTTEKAVFYMEDDTQTTVIRCKDCKWFNTSCCAIEIIDESDKPKENDFCSFAERKEENDER